MKNDKNVKSFDRIYHSRSGNDSNRDESGGRSSKLGDEDLYGRSDGGFNKLYVV